MTRVVFRADADQTIGMGHVSRVISLAQALEGQFRLAMVSKFQACLDLFSANLLDAELVLCPDLKPLEEAVWMRDSLLQADDLLVFDGYGFTTTYQEVVGSKGNFLVAIDDIQPFAYLADVVINHAGGFDAGRIQAPVTARICTGPSYAMLRSPFSASTPNMDRPGVDSLFICLGGADQAGRIAQLIQDLPRGVFSRISVLVSAYTRTQLEALLAPESLPVGLFHDLNAHEVFALMTEHGSAICSASTVAYEYCTVGGLLFCLQTADNQANLFQFLVREGLAYPAESLTKEFFQQETKSLQTEMLVRQANHFDGQAPRRLRKIFVDLDLSRRLTIRRTLPADLMTLFRWVNDPDVRKASYSQEEVTLENHTRWFGRKLNDSGSFMYVFEIDGLPAGQIRFDVGENEALIGYLIDPDFRGHNLATPMLQLGVWQFLQDGPGQGLIVGYVKNANLPSIRAFQKAGFDLQDATPFGYPESVRFSMKI